MIWDLIIDIMQKFLFLGDHEADSCETTLSKEQVGFMLNL